MKSGGRWLREVEVRPVLGVGERRRWDALVAEHHYLPFHGLFGRSLRHVAVRGGTWLALPGWQAGAFKVGVRDAWIGWTREQQFSRLHLVANNARFAVLPAGRVANLASRALGLSLRRLSRDVRAAHGHPVLLAETFVDPSRFAGTCYRASNRVALGRTRGYSREPGGTARWRAHGRRKEVYVYEVEKDAASALRRADLPDGWRAGSGEAPPTAAGLRSLHAFLGDMPDFRKARGRRYPLACYATIMVAARLAGYRGGVTAFAEFAARMDQEQLAAAGAFPGPSRRRHTAPAASTFHHVLSSLPPDALDRALGAWSRQCSDGAAPVALDGKDVRGASKQAADGRRTMVAAVEHGTGLVPGQVQVADKTNETPAVRELTRSLDLRGRAVTLDALHAQQETARALVEDCGADYVAAAVKDNQPTMLDDLRAIDWSRARRAGGEPEKAHGRVERRSCAVVDVGGPEWDGFCVLHGRRQAFRIDRERHVVKHGTGSRETACGLTSLGPAQAGPEQIGELVRRHWHVENRLHHVRDFTCDERHSAAWMNRRWPAPQPVRPPRKSNSRRCGVGPEYRIRAFRSPTASALPVTVGRRDPSVAAVATFLLPDDGVRFQVVHEEFARRERVRTVARRNQDEYDLVAGSEISHPVDHGDGEQPPAVRRLGANALDAGLRHARVVLEVQAAHRILVRPVAHQSAECGHRSGATGAAFAAGRPLSREVEVLALDAHGGLHPFAHQPPVTGGRKATSSPLASDASPRTMRWLTAT